MNFRYDCFAPMDIRSYRRQGIYASAAESNHCGSISYPAFPYPYSCPCPPCPTTQPPKLGGIQMQLIGGARQLLAPNQAVTFDTLLNNQSQAIGYDAGTGGFTLSQVGNYYVSWWIATNGSGSSTNLNFEIQLDSVRFAQSSTAIVTGHLGGDALVTVSGSPVVLTLNNATPDSVAFASTPIQANIIILQVA